MTRRILLLASLVVVAAASTASAARVRDRGPSSVRYAQYGQGQRGYARFGGELRANTPITVRLESQVSTDDSHQGDRWRGRVAEDVMSRRGVVIPAGTPVSGVVTTTLQGTHEQPAELGLALRGAELNGQWLRMNAETEPIVAGSHRAQKLGAIAGGAAVGAIVGHSISHEHGGLIGGLLGGALGYGATQHAFRTLELKPGTLITFTTTQDVYARR